MRISGIEPSSVILPQQSVLKKNGMLYPNNATHVEAYMGGVINTISTTL